jgi:hypothetical protein
LGSTHDISLIDGAGQPLLQFSVALGRQVVEAAAAQSGSVFHDAANEVLGFEAFESGIDRAWTAAVVAHGSFSEGLAQVIAGARLEVNETQQGVPEDRDVRRNVHSTKRTISPSTKSHKGNVRRNTRMRLS